MKQSPAAMERKTPDAASELVASVARARLQVDVAKQSVRLAKEELKRARKRIKDAKREVRRARKRASAARKAWKQARRTGKPGAARPAKRSDTAVAKSAAKSVPKSRGKRKASRRAKTPSKPKVSKVVKAAVRKTVKRAAKAVAQKVIALPRLKRVIARKAAPKRKTAARIPAQVTLPPPATPSADVADAVAMPTPPTET